MNLPLIRCEYVCSIHVRRHGCTVIRCESNCSYATRPYRSAEGESLMLNRLSRNWKNGRSYPRLYSWNVSNQARYMLYSLTSFSSPLRFVLLWFHVRDWQLFRQSSLGALQKIPLRELIYENLRIEEDLKVVQNLAINQGLNERQFIWLLLSRYYTDGDFNKVEHLGQKLPRFSLVELEEKWGINVE